MSNPAPPTGPADSRWFSPQDWSLRVKLAIALLVPSLIAVVLGGLRVADQAGEAAQFDRVARFAVAEGEVADLVKRLQDERLRSIEFVAGERTGDTAALQKSFAAVDAQQASGQPIIEAVYADDGSVLGAYRQSEQALAALPQLRDLVRGSTTSASAVVSRYSEIIDQIQPLDSALLHGVNTAEVNGLANALAALSFARDEATLQQTLVTVAAAAREPVGVELSRLTASEARLATGLDNFRTALDTTQRVQYAGMVAGPANNDRSRLVAELSAADRTGPLPGGTGVRASKVYGDFLAEIDAAETGIRNELATTGQAAKSTAVNLAVLNVAVLLAALIIGAIIVGLIARAIISSLRTLRGSALEIAQKRLPDAVQRMRGGTVPDVNVTPVPIKTREEVGEVARAFDAVHAQAVRLAAEQATLQNTVNSMFVNLSRRSQSLVDRQLQLIEELESNEQDPDQLASLFRLDHLATRMRRNSENLLVLAGTDLAKRTAHQVPVVDVLQAAVSEVEQYERVTVEQPPTVSVLGRAANDLQHLLSELLDNATSFSPPETQVTMSTSRTGTGPLIVEIVDRGIGMRPDELDEINKRFADADDSRMTASRRMGLFVVGRLAARHGVHVRLIGATTSPETTMPGTGPLTSIKGSGVTARVTIPAHLVTSSGPVGARRRDQSKAAAPARSHEGGQQAIVVPPQRSSDDQPRISSTPDAPRERAAGAGSRPVVNGSGTPAGRDPERFTRPAASAGTGPSGLAKRKPTRRDPSQKEAARSDAARSDAARSDAARSDADQSIADRSDSTRSDSDWAESGRSDAARSDSLRPDSARPDSARSARSTSDAAESDVEQSEMDRFGPARAPAGTAGSAESAAARTAAETAGDRTAGAGPAAAGAGLRPGTDPSRSGAAAGPAQPEAGGRAGDPQPAQPPDRGVPAAAVPSMAAPELFGPAPVLEPDGDSMGRTPIFEEVASGWFRAYRQVPINWQPDLNGTVSDDDVDGNLAAVSPPAATPPPTALPPAPPTALPPLEGPLPAQSWPPVGNGSRDDDFATAADDGWRAAIQARQEVRVDVVPGTDLPRRTPGAQLLPGGIGATGTAGSARDAEAVRSRLSNYQRGVRSGRTERERPEQEAADAAAGSTGTASDADTTASTGPESGGSAFASGPAGSGPSGSAAADRPAADPVRPETAAAARRSGRRRLVTDPSGSGRSGPGAGAASNGAAESDEPGSAATGTDNGGSAAVGANESASGETGSEPRSGGAHDAGPVSDGSVSAELGPVGSGSGSAGSAGPGSPGPRSAGAGSESVGRTASGSAAPRSAAPVAAGSGSAGSSSAGSGSAGPGSAGPGSAGSGSAGSGSAGPGSAGSGSAGQPPAESGSAGQPRAGSGSAVPGHDVVASPGARSAGPGSGGSGSAGQPPAGSGSAVTGYEVPAAPRAGSAGSGTGRSGSPGTGQAEPGSASPGSAGRRPARSVAVGLGRIGSSSTRSGPAGLGQVDSGSAGALSEGSGSGGSGSATSLGRAAAADPDLRGISRTRRTPGSEPQPAGGANGLGTNGTASGTGTHRMDAGHAPRRSRPIPPDAVSAGQPEPGREPGSGPPPPSSTRPPTGAPDDRRERG